MAQRDTTLQKNITLSTNCLVIQIQRALWIKLKKFKPLFVLKKLPKSHFSYQTKHKTLQSIIYMPEKQLMLTKDILA